MAEPVIRTANPDDDFSELYPDGFFLLPWDLSLVFVAVEEERVVGALIVWDSNHPLLYVDHFRVREEQRGHYIGYRLLEAVDAYAREHKKTAVFGFALDKEYIEAARRFGAIISPFAYTLLTRVID